MILALLPMVRAEPCAGFDIAAEVRAARALLLADEAKGALDHLDYALPRLSCARSPAPAGAWGEWLQVTAEAARRTGDLDRNRHDLAAAAAVWPAPTCSRVLAAATCASLLASAPQRDVTLHTGGDAWIDGTAMVADLDVTVAAGSHLIQWRSAAGELQTGLLTVGAGTRIDIALPGAPTDALALPAWR